MHMTLDLRMTWRDGSETRNSRSCPRHLLPRIGDEIRVDAEGARAAGKVVAVGWDMEDPWTVRIGLVDVHYVG